MPNQTPNLNLTKPLQTEYYNIDVHNANSDIIDTAIGNINTDKSDKLTAGNAIILTKDTVAKTVNVAVDPNLVSNHNTDSNAHNGVLAKLAGAIFTGDVNVLTPDAADNTQKPANTSWVRSQMQSLVSGCIGAVATAAGFEVSLNTNGYLKLPSWLGGLIIQWGYHSGSLDDLTALVNFNIAFPNACLNVSATGDGPQSSLGNFVTVGLVKIDNTKFRINGYGNSIPTTGYHWFAIGY